jgi:hypothetical protein
MPAESASSRATVRSFRPGDENAILELFARAFHVRRSPEHFAWKYRRNPFGNEHISLAWDEAGVLAGHYAGYPVPFRDGARDLLAHQVGDTMTAPEVRLSGRGPTSILGRTALHFYETFCEGRVAFNYGFNVANIQKFSLRFLRSDRVEEVTYRLRDLRSAPLLSIGRAERLRGGYQLELVRGPGAEAGSRALGSDYDALFERVAPHYGLLVRRDSTYLRWRYLDCPDADYVMVAVRKWRRLAGWIVFRVRGERLTLGDALFDPRWPGALEVVLRHVVPSYPVRVIEGWFPPRPVWLDRLLVDLHFEVRSEPQGLSLMCVPFAWPEATAAMRDRMYYTWGDSDLF